MGQDKAASLTSSLFARKGRASPAGLLIADLEAGETPGATEAPAVDLHDSHNGAPLKRSALELNGQPGRKSSKEPEGELPLLAFVEAQVAADKDQPGEAAEAGAPETDFCEPSPAASLLERSGAGLRRANGRVLDGAAAAGEQEVPITVAAETVPEAATAESEMAAALAEETVSGDANVTAIEDAPAEEAEAAEPADAEAGEAAPEDKEPAPLGAAENEPDVEPEAEATPAPDEKEELAPSSEDTPSPDSRVADDAALSATLALCQASAQGGTAAPQSTVRPTPPPVAPARRNGGSVLWRSAAVVALGAALGLGAYAYLAPGSAPKELQEAGAPVVEALPAGGSAVPEAAPVPSQSTPTEPTDLAEAAPAPAAPEPEPAPPQEAAAELPEPSFDIIRIEPDGQSIIAGRAQPFSEWILLNNGSPIASVKADINGEWVVLPDTSLVPGANAFSLVPKTERGKVAIPAPAEEPEAQAPAAPAESSGPRAEAAAPAEPVALPQAKPQPAPRDALPAFRATPEGGYEVQLASVRQSADAERERQRLNRAYPGLLGELDLRVQEAAVDGAGTFYRIRSGGLAHLGAAREVCRRLEGEGQGCLVVKRVAAAQAGDGADGAEPEPESPPPQQAERPE